MARVLQKISIMQVHGHIAESLSNCRKP